MKYTFGHLGWSNWWGRLVKIKREICNYHKGHSYSPLLNWQRGQILHLKCPKPTCKTPNNGKVELILWIWVNFSQNVQMGFVFFKGKLLNLQELIRKKLNQKPTQTHTYNTNSFSAKCDVKGPKLCQQIIYDNFVNWTNRPLGKICKMQKID